MSWQQTSGTVQGRSFSFSQYRYGFNKEEFILEMQRDCYDLGERIFDCRIARMFSVDPLMSSYPSWSPYAYCGNSPLILIDIKGCGVGDPAKKQKLVSEDNPWKIAKQNYDAYGKPLGLTFAEYWSKIQTWNSGCKWLIDDEVYLEDPNKLTTNEAAQIADHAYSAKSGSTVGTTGWKVSSICVKGVVLNDPKTGFKSAIYEKTTDGVTQYVYAFAGTDDFKDISTDVKQALGKIEKQYPMAQQNARLLASYLKGKSLVFVGHSLGGGLASTGSKSTGNPAITFNAAGLSNSTITRLKLNTKSEIAAYVVKGEAVHYYQSSILNITASGTIHFLEPSKPYPTYEQYVGQLDKMARWIMSEMDLHVMYETELVKMRINNHLMTAVKTSLK